MILKIQLREYAWHGVYLELNTIWFPDERAFAPKSCIFNILKIS